MLLLTPKIKLAIGAAVIAGAFFSGWQTNGWRYQTKIANMERVQADAIADAATEVREIQDRLNKAERVSLAKLEDLENENAALANRVAARTSRLSIKATCPAVDPSGTTPSVGDANSAELTADAGRAYFRLRDGIAKTDAMIEVLQRYADACHLGKAVLVSATGTDSAN